MDPGTCECKNGHKWRALVVEYGDMAGIHVSEPLCPTCKRKYQFACVGFNLIDLEEYCIKYADRIFVRMKVDDAWDSVPLVRVPEHDVVHWIDRWYAERHIPVRVLTDEEIKERKDDAEREAAEENR